MRARRTLAAEAKIPDRKLEQFILDLVNAHAVEIGDDIEKAGDDAGRIFRLYSKFLPHVPMTPQEAYQKFMLLVVLKMRRKPSDSGLLLKEEEDYQRGFVAEMRDQLRAVWTASDAETAEWRLMSIYSLMQELMARTAKPETLTPDVSPSQSDVATHRALPLDAPLSQAMVYIWRKLGKLKKCPNPECPNTFFIAVKEGQPCCSEECAAVNRSEYKKTWWRRKRRKLDNGKQPQGDYAVRRGEVKKAENRGGQSSIGESAVKAFILDVVNSEDGKIDDGKMYLFSRHPAFFPTKDQDIRTVLSLTFRNLSMREQLKSEFPRMYHRRLFRDLRDGLRHLWQSKDEFTAAWMLFRLRSVMHSRMEVHGGWERTLQPPSAHAPIHQALRWVRQHLSKLRKCRNRKCPRPFFVAAANQRFCSKACAHDEQKMLKKKWWADHGEEWRRKWLDEQKRGHKPTAPKRKHS